MTTHSRSPLAAGMALFALVVAGGCAADTERDGRRPGTPVPVSVATIAPEDVPGTFEAGGTVQAETMAVLTARILSPVREVRVSPGDRVRAGQVLVVLDASDLEAQARSARAAADAATQGSTAAEAEARAAQAALTLARATHERVASLQSKGSATRQELDEATATLQAAEARAASAAARLQEAVLNVGRAQAASEAAGAADAFTRITAPFDGLVTEKLVDPGAMASPGTPLVRVEDTRGFRLEVRVDESRAAQVTPGAAAAVVLEQGAPLSGTVSEVARAVEADARAFLVKVALPDTPGLRSGMFGRARFTGPARQVVTVPAEALVRRGQVTSVFVVDNGVARLRLVSVSGTEVLAGLSPGDAVILNPAPDIVDGRPVSPGGR
jgi:RND family efflux transporter MFP subunit